MVSPGDNKGGQEELALSAVPSSDQVSNESDIEPERSIPKQREQTRTILAQGLLIIFAGSILATFIWVFSFEAKMVCYPEKINDEQEKVCSIDTTGKDMISFLLSSITTILGTALGFYFGSETTSDGKDNQE